MQEIRLNITELAIEAVDDAIAQALMNTSNTPIRLTLEDGSDEVWEKYSGDELDPHPGLIKRLAEVAQQDARIRVVRLMDFAYEDVAIFVDNLSSVSPVKQLTLVGLFSVSADTVGKKNLITALSSPFSIATIFFEKPGKETQKFIKEIPDRIKIFIDDVPVQRPAVGDKKIEEAKTELKTDLSAKTANLAGSALVDIQSQNRALKHSATSAFTAPKKGSVCFNAGTTETALVNIKSQNRLLNHSATSAFAPTTYGSNFFGAKIAEAGNVLKDECAKTHDPLVSGVSKMDIS